MAVSEVKREEARGRIAHPDGPRRWKWVGKLLLSAWRTTTHFPERMPESGGVLVVANHLTYLDGPMVYRVSPRDMHLLVQHEVFVGIVGWALRSSGQIPIDRDSHDRRALDTALSVLRRGGVLGMFPEGSRGGGTADSVRSGAAWLALQADVPILPVAVLGTRRRGDKKTIVPPLGRKIDIVFGEPLRLQRLPGQSGRELRQAASDQLQTALADHVRAAIELTGQTLPTAEDVMGAGATPPKEAS